MTLDPKPPKEVFDDHDGQCTKKVPLTDLVEAELQTLNEAEKKYTLTVKTAPVHDAVLCYKCVKETTPPQPTPDPSVEAAAKAVEHCMLKIAVKGTSDPSTSAAALLAVPSFFVWEFVLGSLRA
ncbi:SAG-related sequence [Besnoitia besnoiti]|uniref:SAG-related sequence n=1 Tax=Besnoitia besnoiti TaxID=94643 RepID=A0A2A9MI87_BESBE|nr:SAG-related sequence [Besnoitia besnoiti]PFH36914.1 SAG-related sequence [Besnoitia besnoiti]